MGMSLPQLIIILLIVLVLFGGGRLASLMGDLGKGIRNLRDELEKSNKKDNSNDNSKDNSNKNDRSEHDPKI